MALTIKRYPTLTSTSTEAAALGDKAVHGTVVVTDCQTAGRGQRGNSWEAEPGRNLTFSLVLRPQAWQPARQFELSMVNALAMVQVLDSLLDDAADSEDDSAGGVTDNARHEADNANNGRRHRAYIKWPNDIYVDDLKISGVLIENVISATSIHRMIIGAGININQTAFSSPAPNPVSLKQLTGQDYDLDDLLTRFATAMTEAIDSYVASPDPESMAARYHSRLWRNDGQMHRWIDKTDTPDNSTVAHGDTADSRIFTAAISGVQPDGTLTMRLPDGSSRVFAFKQVAAVL